ncbi:MAG: insulinase family protein [Spirochaetes bacterium]|nr:insulinase family protein [Spirochaetota bacterium]
MTETYGFEILKKQKIKELNCDALFFKHIKTGAELLSIVNDDENKVFGITFRTPPGDSTGVPHILEHSVLCGSRKYSVKEPFVELLKGSLQTFLNAFTYPDKTCYPVASQNLKDFYNLVDVYLDAVFYPRITKWIFQQEGWHYELNEAEEPLIIKGVVYNEMKGAYSSPDSLLAQYSQQSLFPDNAYSMESGGDPRIIPQLTYESFLDFHKKLYHPSNSRIFFYGDDDPENRLKLLNEYLKDFSKIHVSSAIDLQKKFKDPLKLEVPFVAEAGEGKAPTGMITVNWMLGETTDIETNVGLQVLTYILLGMPASPLRKALIESGLGERLAGVGIENELRQMYFSAGLKGIEVKDAALVEKLIDNTLSDLKTNGLDKLTIEAAFNTIEFALRENNSGSYPRGLSLMLKSLTTWLYDSDPLALVAFENPLQNLKARYASDPSLFAKMIDQYLLSNLHRTTVILKPDANLAEKERTRELDLLNRKKKSMSRDDILYLIKNTQELKQMQETPDSAEAVAAIPFLRLSEIDKKNRNIPLSCEKKKVDLFYHDLSTNGILYFDLGLRINALPQKYLPYMTVFGKALQEMGTEKEDYVSFSQRISRKTGGISRSLFSSLIKDTDSPVSWMFIRGKALTNQFGDMLDILSDMLFKVRFDNRERFKQIVLETKSALEQSIIPAGNRYVNVRINSHFNKAAWAEEQMSGISSLFFLRDITDKIDNDWPHVLRDLEEIYRTLVCSGNILINTAIDEKNWTLINKPLYGFMDSLPAGTSDPEHWSPVNRSEFEGLVIPAQVNYVGKGSNLYRLGYSYNGSINVISHFLRTSYLWDNVRVQGGAYGAMCQFNRMSGVMSFVSYRDPNLKKTLDIFSKAALFLKNLNISDVELQKSIIGAIGDIDSYMLPDVKSYTSLLRSLSGNSDEDRQIARDQILGTSPADFKAFADVLENACGNSIVKIMGGRNAFEEAYSSDEMPELVKVL